jgi:hypothetical protein
MYQITALYGDAEIAYAEGQYLNETWDACEDSIPDVYRALMDEIVLQIVRPNGTVRRYHI